MSDNSPHACMAAFVAALIRKDIGPALALLAEDVVFFYSNGSALWGKEAFAAAVIYTFSWSGVADGKEIAGGGRGTRIFRREPAGWRIAHEHLSAGHWKQPVG